MKLYREGAEGVEIGRAGCKKRSCRICRPRWNRAAVARVIGGIPRDEPGRVWYVVLTAPGLDRIASPGAAVEWNGRSGSMVRQFIREVRRHAPGRVEYVATPELQARGVLHFNVLLRDAVLTAADVQRWAVGAGFGEVVYASPARTSVGLGRYIAGYIVKARDVFPPGFRVVRASEGWGLPAEAVPAPEAAASAQSERSEQAAAVPSEGAGLLIAEAGEWLPYPVSEERRAEGTFRRAWRRMVGRREFETRCGAMFEARSLSRGWLGAGQPSP